MRPKSRERADLAEGRIAAGCERREGDEGQGGQGRGKFERGGERAVGSVPWGKKRQTRRNTGGYGGVE